VLTVLAAGSEAAADCTCRLPGTSAPLGSIACLSPGGKSGLYRCDMNLNITSWQRIGDVCPTARSQPQSPKQSVTFIVFAAAARPH
jgi:hypothetical protein